LFRGRYEHQEIHIPRSAGSHWPAHRFGLARFRIFLFRFSLPELEQRYHRDHHFLREKREYLLYVPKSYDRAKPPPLVINLHTSMSWPSSSMAISQWNQVADERGFIVAYPEGTGLGPKSWEMTGSETPARMPDVIFISELIDKCRQAPSVVRQFCLLASFKSSKSLTEASCRKHNDVM
jgi:poly(3-hydroxybutyrate) depolymerase